MVNLQFIILSTTLSQNMARMNRKMIIVNILDYQKIWSQSLAILISISIFKPLSFLLNFLSQICSQSLIIQISFIMKNQVLHNKRSAYFGFTMGGLSSVPLDSVVNYCCRLRKNKIVKLHKQVQDFKQTILDDPILRMNFNTEVIQKLEVHGDKGRLLGDNFDQAIELINTAVSTPPSFQDQDITGVPVYALFMDYIECTEGQTFFASPVVNSNLKSVFSIYTRLLDSPESLKYISGWISGKALKYWTPSEYKIDLKAPNFGFKCWHDFFLRQFKPESRPIAQGDNVIANVCESYPLVYPLMPVENVQLRDNFWLKDNRYSLVDMVASHKLQDPKVVQEFVGGTVYQAFLNPWTYHRWHSPVDGTLLAAYPVPGAYYLQNPGIIDQTGKEENYINSQPFLTATSTRQVFLIDADNKKIGKIFVIMVGMCEVSTCYSPRKIGQKVKKGQYMGQFRFGGSSHCVIFNKNCILDFSETLNKAYYYDPNIKDTNSYRVPVHSKLATVLY